jgi:hypothetical protein
MDFGVKGDDDGHFTAPIPAVPLCFKGFDGAAKFVSG